MEKDTLKSKFLGSLIGTAVGDSLGASLEGWHRFPPEEIYARAENRELLVYTDDTHMAIGIAESLIYNNGFNGKHMADTFIENFDREPFRGYGPGPPRIFRMIKAGEDWNKASEMLYEGGSFGNGSAMRIAPVGVFYHDDFDKLKEVSYESSHITHAHELGKEGGALQACAVALAINLELSSRFESGDFLAELHSFAKHPIYKDKLTSIGNLLGQRDVQRVVANLGNGIEAFNSVPAAIFSFLSNLYSFEDAVVYAISLGGDTDTIGAMTGAISGAYLGVESIPDKWMNKLENRTYLEELALKLWEIKTEQ
jgi:poly(ADP-ribose) glycohydrolase ARH3